MGTHVLEKAVRCCYVIENLVKSIQNNCSVLFLKILGMAKTPEDSQEVPSLDLDLSREIHDEFQPNFIDGYEDLGVFFHSDIMKEV